MSFHTVSGQAPQPVTTTTNTTTTTTTTTASTEPLITSRPAGWHAKTLDFDWNISADQKKYLDLTGLPAAHAAIINNDWDAAASMLTPKDIGLSWLPAVS